MFILLPVRNKLGLGVLTFFPFNSISVEVANAMVLLVSSVLAYNLLKLLTPDKTLVDTFLLGPLAMKQLPLPSFDESNRS